MPHFLKIILGFGKKMSSRDENFMASYTHLSDPMKESELKEDGFEENLHRDTATSHICYNVRHFERHGRELDDPWSCRQSAIHQGYSFGTRQSRWIVVQPPVVFLSNLSKRRFNNTSHPLDLHIQYLNTATAEWREYLNHIAEKLKLLDEVVAIFKPYGEFGLDFSSKQQIHNLRRKLFYAQSILANTLDILKTIGSHEKTVARMIGLPPSVRDRFQREIQNLARELRNYMRTTRELLDFSDAIRLMYDDILRFYGQELAHNNGARLTQIAQADSTDTKTIVSLIDKTYQDSHMVRIVTVITLFYLPANLVMSFFSTTLVWFDNDDERGQTGSKVSVLRVHREMWIAVLTTVLLATGTILISSWWERRARVTDLERVC
ncbi:hypothetical protein K491DRAFT_720887 [Lophiostoma macrostomum CBS 122681]|uniref:CorA-like transporter domain-containing protein n=1 Tax=Lophiostoma macrostomum CBS 122681 TaxID=1314788 RepID=A0A6A6SRF3_9PLEO|nr:hypothetical protein K491DRAFT_720887 [Lophiostoma macrostomum CBS 122681]